MTDKNRLQGIAESASDSLISAYWAACDAVGGALDPSDLTSEVWAADLLAEQYDYALRVAADPFGWPEGRAKL